MVVRDLREKTGSECSLNNSHSGSHILIFSLLKIGQEATLILDWIGLTF